MCSTKQARQEGRHLALECPHTRLSSVLSLHARQSSHFVSWLALCIARQTLHYVSRRARRGTLALSHAEQACSANTQSRQRVPPTPTGDNTLSGDTPRRRQRHPSANTQSRQRVPLTHKGANEGVTAAPDMQQRQTHSMRQHQTSDTRAVRASQTALFCVAL